MPKLVVVEQGTRNVEMLITASQIHYTIPVLDEQRLLGNIQQIDLRNGKIQIVFAKKHLTDGIKKEDVKIEQRDTLIQWS